MIKYYGGEMFTIPKEFEEETRADERRKFAEWFAKCSKVSEPVLEHTVNRWIEDYEKEQKQELFQVAVWQVYTKDGKATGQIYVDGDEASKCAKTIDGYVVEARLIKK